MYGILSNTFQIIAQAMNFKSFLIGSLVLLLGTRLMANDTLLAKKNDSLTLAQAYINLTLTQQYFDTLSNERILKILPFEKSELKSIEDSEFIKGNNTLYNFTYSLLYLNEAKLLSRTITKYDRENLLQWKNLLDTAITYFNNSDIDSYYTVEKVKNSFYELISFNEASCRELMKNISDLKSVLTRYINLDIYPDFKRIYFEAKNTNQHHLDSLSYYANIYDLPLDMSVKNNVPEPQVHENYGMHNLSVKSFDSLATALDLISKYLQLKYVIKEYQPRDTTKLDLYNLYHSFFDFRDELNPADSLHFQPDDGIIQKDSFFNKEINQQACDSLYQLLQQKFPYKYSPILEENMGGEEGPFNHGQSKYYFPIPAPFPSAYLSITNYQPGLNTMKQVDNYLKIIFNNAGYSGHLHYYYVESGFAVTTSLEKINKDGSPVSGSKRWHKSIGGNGSFSLYETFKSIFFATESNFRIIALVIAPNAATVQSSPASIGAMQDLLTYSYPSLPADLQNFSLPKKTLTILIYNFYQSDIGKVPMLDVSKRLSVRDHLKKSRLTRLLNR